MRFDVLRKVVGEAFVLVGEIVSGERRGNPGCREDDEPEVDHGLHLVPVTISEKGRSMIAPRAEPVRIAEVPDPPLRGSVVDRMRRQGRT